MASDNTVTLVGNITDDPELRFTPSGAAVVNFTVAVNRRYRNNEGQWEDKLDGFFRCNCWREMAENVAESLVKGSRVMVVGRLQQRSWETSEGQKRYEIEVQVDEVGPSLRWATASPQKSQRSSGGAQWAPSDQSSPAPAPQQAAPAPAPQQAAPAPQQAAPAPVPQAQPQESGGSANWGSPAPVGGSGPEEEGTI